MNFKRLIFFLSFLFVLGEAPGFAGKYVVLTIDDGPHEGYTERLIEVLNEKEVTATFFLVGKMIERYPRLVEKIYNSGFEIGNHTYNDIRMDSMTEEQIVLALEPVNELLEDITGKRTSFFRPPGGRLNRLVLEKAREFGYHTVLWTRNSMDTAPGITPRQIYYHSTRNPRRREIILLHSGVEATVQALEEIIDYYKNEGYEFKTVADISVPLLAGRRSILKGTDPAWPYILRRKEQFEYPPVRNNRMAVGVLMFFGFAAGTVFLIKKTSLKWGEKVVSLAFIGAKTKYMKKILKTLDKEQIQASFFLPANDIKINSGLLNGHAVGVLGKSGSVEKQIKRWKENYGGGDYGTLPLYYCEAGYRKEEIKEIKDEGFIPVDFRIHPPEKRPAAEKDLYEYARGSLGAGKTLPLRGDCSFTSKILPSFIKKIREKGYELIPLRKYIVKKHVS